MLASTTRSVSGGGPESTRKSLQRLTEVETTNEFVFRHSRFVENALDRLTQLIQCPVLPDRLRGHIRRQVIAQRLSIALDGQYLVTGEVFNYMILEFAYFNALHTCPRRNLKCIQLYHAVIMTAW